MSDLRRTLFYERHKELGAKIVEFGGWEMPVFYASGIVDEHLATRKNAGLFDVSHMGRFLVRGDDAPRFLQHVLTNHVEALDPGTIGAQYSFIPDADGGAIDDVYLYRFTHDEYLLVVNAANREKDWIYLRSFLEGFQDVELVDRTEEIVMLALQGPKSRDLLNSVISSGSLPDPARNSVSIVSIRDTRVMIARTGYTGEPICFELFSPRSNGRMLWDLLLEKGASPVGLGARDTLRLEAGLPLYGHELGDDPDGNTIPVMACPLARFAVSFSTRKRNYIGREELTRQNEALKKITRREFSQISDLPRLVRSVAVKGKGIARQGARVLKDGKHVGWVTSGTRVPLWNFEGEGLESKLTDQRLLRSICLAYLDSDILDEDELLIDIRGKMVDAVVVPYHMRSDAPPHARPIIYDFHLETKDKEGLDAPRKAFQLLEKTVANTVWRQRECINLIPSEMTLSPMARLISVMDPSFRYAEHKKAKAFYDAEIFYYQGTEFIAEAERLLEYELRKFLGCHEAETRVISGQMANTAVFSAMVDYINRTDRRSEPRRIGRVMNNHIGRGGHLSAQPMGALRDFVARDPRTERPSVINFPVTPDDPYRIDVQETLKLIDEYGPELIIFGKSMVLYKEPVTEIRRFLDERSHDCVLMYDMAHVLGLIGPHFQQPFAEGADLVTGSTHKTFFGTQRGVIGSRFEEHEERYELWEAIVRRAFPGSVSNHHLGTLLGLLMAAYEMNHFKNEYQSRVISNAKVFARALHDCGLDVAGNSDMDFTETHQVVVHVGYGKGPETAKRLEANNIICNYQASPLEEGFTAAGALRMGVSEMTRFGMGSEDFKKLASLIHDVIVNDTSVVEPVKNLRQEFSDIKYCFKGEDFTDLVQHLHTLF